MAGAGQGGAFYGGMTIQGLLPYYFMHYWPGLVGKSEDASTTTWPRTLETWEASAGRLPGRTVPPASGAYTCLIEKGDCEDCRLSRVEDVKVVHFTICQKPGSATPLHVATTADLQPVP